MARAPYSTSRLLATAWAATLAVALTLLSPLPIPAQDDSPGLFGVPHVDKLAHLFLFLGLGWVWRRSFRSAGRPVSYGAIFLAVVAYGALLELVQGWSGLRTAEWADLAADALGAGLVPLWRPGAVQTGATAGSAGSASAGAEAAGASPADSR